MANDPIRLLALSDRFIPADFMRAGLARLSDLGIEVEVREWAHARLADLQRDNATIEREGPDAVPLPAELTRGWAGFDIVVTQFAPLSRRSLESAEKLQVIGVLRTGLENVAVQAATQRGITVLNTPGRLSRAVAECTVGLILAEIRNLARAHAKLARGQWEKLFPNSEDIPELYRRTVGLVGYGAVGRMVAAQLQGFGCRLLAYDPYPTGDPAPARLVDLPALLRESDVVSLHARLTAETRHLIGAPQLALMKPTAILVNTARSGLLDETALVEALAARRIMGAALDVFEVEPLPPEHPLLKLDNVTLTPHLAGSTRDGFRNTPVLMADFLARLLAGQGPLPIVNGLQPALRGRGRLAGA